jgi:hypothetical protein
LTRLVEIAKVIRSKNAKPFVLTIDILFADPDAYTRVVESKGLTAEVVATAYGVAAEEVQVIPYPAARAIKVTFPRPSVAGSFDDRDLLGAQQAVPLFEVDIPEHVPVPTETGSASAPVV